MSQICTIANKIIQGSKNLPIVIDAVFPEGALNLPVVIFIHGFKGFKDWGHFNWVAKTLAANGFVCVKFNFSHNGTSPDHLTEFVNLEAFGNNNYLLELSDLTLVIDWVLNSDELKEKINSRKLFLIGHSRGGGIAVLQAAQDKRITGLVTWAAVGDFVNRYNPNTIAEWKKNGVIYSLNGRTKQNMPLYYQLYESTIANKKKLDILKHAQKLTIPYLIVHGKNDEAVSYKEAMQLNKYAKLSELILIENSGHTFEARHPFSEEKIPSNLQKVMHTTLSFLKR